jgi:exo-beta-1,3-glucanase (GH17 family)
MLIPWISDTRSMLSSMGLGNILVGNADAGSYFNNEVLSAVDYGVGILLYVCLAPTYVVQMANVHPWFANQSIENAAAWTANFFATTDYALAQNLTNKPKMFIAETGWPTVCSRSLSSLTHLTLTTGHFFFQFQPE